MKNIVLRFPLFLLFVFAIALASCSGFGKMDIEKRHYRNGFYVHKTEKHETVAVNKTTVQNETERAAETAPAVVPAATVSVPVKTAPAFTEEKTPAVKKANQPSSGISNPQVKKAPLKKLSAFLKKEPAKKSAPAAGADGDVTLIILVILAIILSPLAVFLKQGITTYFWIDLICWILGGGLVFSPFFYGGALLLFAIIFALLIVLDVI